MRVDLAELPGGAEPLFEPPPRMTPRTDRRLTVRAAAGFAADGAHGFRDNAVTLGVDAHDSWIVAIGATVARELGLVTGSCADAEPDTLAASLRDACDLMRVRSRVIPFETVVRTPYAACVLLRGVLLPQEGGGAEAVLSWKQVLDADAAMRLRAELLHELRGRPPLPMAVLPAPR